jgi:hypothetical protein
MDGPRAKGLSLGYLLDGYLQGLFNKSLLSGVLDCADRPSKGAAKSRKHKPGRLK